MSPTLLFGIAIWTEVLSLLVLLRWWPIPVAVLGSAAAGLAVWLIWS